MQFKPSDIVIPLSQNTEQSPPQKLVAIHEVNDTITYELEDGSHWPEIIPGNRQTWALVTLRHGYSVIPIEKGGKRPPVVNKQNGARFSWEQYQNRHADEQEVKEWFDRWPDCNYGIVAGFISEVIILDIDGPIGEKYVKDQSGIPKTPISTTGKGRHIHFKHPGYKVGNRVFKELELDIRADGGYIVAPASWHAEKQKTYRWLKSPWDTEITDAPLWLLELAQKKNSEKSKTNNNESYAEAAFADELSILARAQEGERNDQLNRSAFALGQLVGAGVLEENRIKTSLFAVATAKGLNEKEANATIESGIESGKQQPRDIPERDYPDELPPLPKRNDLVAEIQALRKERSDEYWLLNKEAPDYTEQIDRIFEKAGALTEGEFNILAEEVTKDAQPLTTKTKTKLKQIWRQVNRGAQILRQAQERQQRPSSWPYKVKNGRIVYLSDRTFGEQVTVNETPVCDFTATIAEEITDEGGSKTFVVKGKPVRGNPFQLEIDAEDFGSDYQLKAKLDGASGAKAPVRAGMGKHLAPAIQLLTGDEMLAIKRYKRVGWAGDLFLIPGKEPQNIRIEPEKKLAYRVDPNADFQTGLSALENLILSVDAERSTPVISYILQAPLAYWLDWRNHRYAMFVSGRTGCFKTSFAMLAMCLYGPAFKDNSMLIKWGEGATRTSVMLYAAYAHDMPLLIDNYKPTTGRGSADFINLIHNIVEGGDKDRANRNAELRKTKDIFCWPFCTGEDVPDTDASSLSRLLNVPFIRRRNADNPKLTTAQMLSDHLCAVGGEWISWIETKDARQIAKRINTKFIDYRTKWSDKLGKIRDDISNPWRISSSIAINQICWEIAMEHPTIGPLARKYKDAHYTGLNDIIVPGMAQKTAEAFEAVRFISSLQELIDAERAILLPREEDPNPIVSEDEKWDMQRNRDRLIGWYDDDGIYLVTKVARKMSERLLGGDDLGDISNHTLYTQLEWLGLIAQKSKSTVTRSVRIRGSNKRVLHLVPDALTSTDDEDEDIPF